MLFTSDRVRSITSGHEDYPEFGNMFSSQVLTEELGSIGSAYPKGSHRVASILFACGEENRIDESWVKEISPKDAQQLQDWISEAEGQYLSNIAPEVFLDRTPSSSDEFEFCEGFEDWTVDRIRSTYSDKGITPFLLLRQVTFCQAHGVICFDFDCSIEIYFDEHEFSFDYSPVGVKLATPRHLLIGSSYPAG